jgi:cell division protein FtsW
MGLINKLFRGDRSIWSIFMILCLVSLVEVYSATSTLAYKNTHYWAPIVRHATFLLSGFGLVLLLQHIPSKYFQPGVLILLLSIGLLIITPFFGVETNEAHRWLTIFGIRFQPSELAKLGCIIFVAFMLSKQELIKPKVTFWVVLLVVIITCILIVLDNFSTACLLFLVCYLMMFIGHVPMKWMGLLTGSLVLFVVIVLATLHYMPEEAKQKYLPARATTWAARFEDYGKDKGENKYTINDDNFQVNHAKIAIARGGLFGKLPGRSIQRDFLPQAYSDFIYAIIIEEMGLLFGGIIVLMLYVFLMFRVGIIARRCEKQFPRYLALGCGLLIVIQAFINMAVAVNLIPVTGQPLPLISRGGTSTMITCCYFGMILSISRFGAGMDVGKETEEIEEADEEADEETEIVVFAESTNDGIAGLSEEEDEEEEEEEITEYEKYP